MSKELNEYRSQIERNNADSETYRVKIQKLMSQNTSLNEEVNIAQENLRLSANTVSKLNNELKVVCNENEELKRRIDELARMVQSKNREMKNLSENTIEVDSLSRQVKGLNDQIRRVTG